MQSTAPVSTGHGDGATALPAQVVPAAAPADPPPPRTVAEQIAALRAGAGGSKSKNALKKPAASVAMKRPAAAASVAMKRPAAASAPTGCEEGHGKKVAKKVATSPAQKKEAKPASKKATGPKGTQSRDERRRAILAVVPKAMQQRYKDGCLRMAPKKVKEEKSDSEYSYVETEHEEEPAAEAPTREERERASSVVPETSSIAAAGSAPSMPPPARPPATRRDRRAESEESDRAPRARAAVSPFSPTRGETHADESGRRKTRRGRGHVSRAAETAGDARPADVEGRAPPEGNKGKGKRRRRGESQSCPVCWAPVGRHESSLSQHQYWSEDCNARRIYAEQNCSWTSARRQALQLKEAREDAYYNQGVHETPPATGVHVTPAPSLAAKREFEGDGEDAAEDDEREARPKTEARKEKTKKKKRRHHRRHSPSPEVARDRRRSKRPPSSDGEDDLPKVKRGPGGTFILQFAPRAH
eukprot:s146_g5.t1